MIAYCFGIPILSELCHNYLEYYQYIISFRTFKYIEYPVRWITWKYMIICGFGSYYPRPIRAASLTTPVEGYRPLHGIFFISVTVEIEVEYFY